MICTIIILLMLVVNLTIVATKHGQVKDEVRYNFWTDLIVTVIIILLYWGAGLFDKF